MLYWRDLHFKKAKERLNAPELSCNLLTRSEVYVEVAARYLGSNTARYRSRLSSTSTEWERSPCLLTFRRRPHRTFFRPGSVERRRFWFAPVAHRLEKIPAVFTYARWSLDLCDQFSKSAEIIWHCLVNVVHFYHAHVKAFLF